MLTLSTDRLTVREADAADAPAVTAYVRRNRDHLAPFEPARDATYYTESYWRTYLTSAPASAATGLRLDLFIYLSDMPDRLIGRLAFSNLVRGVFQACHVGFSIDRDEQGRGYMTESLRAGIEHMFSTQNLHRIMANYMPRNIASAAVLRKLGFEIEGTARAYLRINGVWEDHVLTSLINNDWEPR